VFFDYRGGAFRVSITRTRVKYRLLLEAPQVTLVVDDAPMHRTLVVDDAPIHRALAADGAPMHRALVADDAPIYRTVVVSGRAEIHDDDASLLALSRSLRAKYGSGTEALEDGDDELLRALHEEQRVVAAITPEQVLSWAGG